MSSEHLPHFGLLLPLSHPEVPDEDVSVTNDGEIKIWSTSTGECLRTLTGHQYLVRALSVDPEAGRLVSVSYDQTVKVWDFHTGTLMRDFRHTSYVFDVKFDCTHIVRSGTSL